MRGNILLGGGGRLERKTEKERERRERLQLAPNTPTKHASDHYHSSFIVRAKNAGRKRSYYSPLPTVSPSPPPKCLSSLLPSSFFSLSLAFPNVTPLFNPTFAPLRPTFPTNGSTFFFRRRVTTFAEKEEDEKEGHLFPRGPFHPSLL